MYINNSLKIIRVKTSLKRDFPKTILFWDWKYHSCNLHVEQGNESKFKSLILKTFEQKISRIRSILYENKYIIGLYIYYIFFSAASLPCTLISKLSNL